MNIESDDTNGNVNAQQIPDELKSLRQWVAWRFEETDKARPTKVPKQAWTQQANASTTDSRSWTSFLTAFDHFSQGRHDGIGFVFTEKDPYCGIDLDGCRDPETGEIEQFALDILADLDSYSEISQSGRGIHVIIRACLVDEETGDILSGTKRKLPGTTHEIEIYDRTRYFATTGDRLIQYPADIQDRQEQTLRLYHTINPPEADARATRKASTVLSAIPDDTIIQKASQAKNGAKFQQLMDGDISDYPSGSEADLALCNILKFWTQDQEQIFRIVQQSGLWDKKWEREDYRARTIGKALDSIGEAYDWDRDSKPDESGTHNGPDTPEEFPQRVFARDGRYWARRKAGKEDAYIEVPISNFTTNVRRSIYTPDEVIRQITFRTIDDEESDPFDLKASAMVTPLEFRKFCLSRGNYFWDGKQDELKDLLECELAKSDGLIYQPDRIGYIADGKFWLFGNLAVPEGEKPIYPDAEGILWVGNKGYLPLAFEGSGDGGVLPIASERTDIDDYIQSVLNATYRNLEFNAWLGLGFCAAHVYLPEIVAEFRCFPELLLYGKLKAGKNTLARWLLSFFGLSCPEKTISETTQNWIARALSYYSSMPVWLDEYRNERRIREKNGVLRNAFDRIGSGKGQLGFGGAGYPVRGSVLLSGQTIPDDSALLSRCCVIRLTRKTRDDKYFDEVNHLAGDFSAILIQLVRYKSNEQARRVLKSIKAHRGQLIEKGIDDRDATIYSIIIAGVELLCQDIAQRKAFTEWVYQKESERDKLTKEEESELAVFWDDVLVLLADGRISNDQYLVESKNIYLWFTPIYNTWQASYRQRTGETPFGRSAILDYLKEEDYYEKHNVQKKIKGTNRKCLILAKDRLPEFVKSAFDPGMTI